MIKLFLNILFDEKGILRNLPSDVAPQQQQGGISTSTLLTLLLQKKQTEDAAKLKERLQQQKLQDPFEQLKRQGTIAEGLVNLRDAGAENVAGSFEGLLQPGRLGTPRLGIGQQQPVISSEVIPSAVIGV